MSRAVNPAPDADAQLVRAIGLSGATLLVVGSVIGSGIFLTTGLMVQELPSTSLVLAAWVAGPPLSHLSMSRWLQRASAMPCRSIQSRSLAAASSWVRG